MTELKKTPVEPVLMYTDKEAVESLIAGHRSLLDSLNPIIKTLKDKGFVFQDLHEVKDLLHAVDLASFLKMKQVRRAKLEIGGLILDKAQIANFVTLPDLGHVPARLATLQM